MILNKNSYQLTNSQLHFLSGEKGVYLSALFRSLGMYLVTVFIPLYVYHLTGQLDQAFFFYGWAHLFVLLTLWPAGWLTRQIGVDWTVLIGSFFRGLFLYFLILAANDYLYLYLAAGLWGAAVSFYWLPFHYTVVGTEEEDGLFGKETSMIMIFYKLTASLGPLIGGFLAGRLGFDWLYRVAILFVILGGLPMFFDCFRRRGMGFEFQSIKQGLFKRENRSFILAFAGAGFKDVILGVAWPLFIFLIVGRYETVGLIQGLSLFLSVIFLWRLGRWIDKRGIKVLRLGIVLNNVIWLIRAFLVTPAAVIFSNIIYDLGNLLIFTPFDAFFYQCTLAKRKLEFIAIREIAIHSGGLIGCLLVWQLLDRGIGWFWIFSLAVIGLFLVSLILREVRE